MSTTDINFQWTVNGTPTDVASIVLQAPATDPHYPFGVLRTDTNASIVAAGTALTRLSAGTYQYSFTDPAPGLTYQYYILVTYGGATYSFERSQSESAPVQITGSISTPTSYLDQPTADGLAAFYPLLKNWPAATTPQKTAALTQATQDIDIAFRYQGRKYDLTQILEFPRMAFEAAARVRNWGVMAQPVVPPGYGDVVWDWDSVNLVQVVPVKVLQAVLYQADFLLGGVALERIDEQHAGVKSTSGGGVSEDFDPHLRAKETGLCRRSYQLLRDYRAMAGRMM